MRKVLATLLTLSTLMLLLSACNAEEKLAEKIGEEMMEEAAGDDVDIDIDGDDIEIEMSDGGKVNIGGGDWPDSDMAKLISEYKSGEIEGVIETADYVQVIITDSDHDYFDSYMADVKKDFPNDSMEAKSDENISYYGTDNNGNTISIYFDGGEVVIAVQKSTD